MKSNQVVALFYGAGALVNVSVLVFNVLHGFYWPLGIIATVLAAWGFFAAYWTWTEGKHAGSNLKLRGAVKIGNRIYKPLRGAGAEGIQEWFTDAEKISADPCFDVAERAIVKLLERYDPDMVYQVIDTIFAPRSIPSFRFKEYHFARWPWALESDVPGWAERTARTEQRSEP
jgi:hypothetical protein